MKWYSRLAAVGALAFLAGCATSTPDDRIAAHQAAFSSWPANVQAMVRAGQVGVGFNAEQVIVALGEPASRTTSANPNGVTEVWYYHSRAPRLSLAVGGASFGRHDAMAGGAAVNGIPLGRDMSGQVVFVNGFVTQTYVTQ